jgi:hypothetical protein
MQTLGLRSLGFGLWALVFGLWSLGFGLGSGSSKTKDLKAKDLASTWNPLDMLSPADQDKTRSLGSLGNIRVGLGRPAERRSPLAKYLTDPQALAYDEGISCRCRNATKRVAGFRPLHGNSGTMGALWRPSGRSVAALPTGRLAKFVFPKRDLPQWFAQQVCAWQR